MKKIFLRYFAIGFSLFLQTKPNAHELTNPVKLFETALDLQKKPVGSPVEIAAPKVVWRNDNGILHYVTNSGKTKKLLIGDNGTYGVVAAPEVLEPLDLVMGFNLAEEVYFYKGTRGLSTYYKVEKVKLKTGAYIDGGDIQKLMYSPSEVNMNFVYRAIPNTQMIEEFMRDRHGKGPTFEEFIMLVQKASPASNKAVSESVPESSLSPTAH